MRSSYLRVVTLYIHPLLELTLLQHCSLKIKLFLAFSYRQELLHFFTTLHTAAINPCTIGPCRDSVLNLNALALLILNAGLSLICELAQ
jgi:hypothetical protein